MVPLIRIEWSGAIQDSSAARRGKAMDGFDPSQPPIKSRFDLGYTIWLDAMKKVGIEMVPGYGLNGLEPFKTALLPAGAKPWMALIHRNRL